MTKPDKWERRRIRNMVIKRAGRTRPERVLSRKQKESEARAKVDFISAELLRRAEKKQNGNAETSE